MFMKETGKKTKQKAWESIFIMMVLVTKAIGRMINRRDMEKRNGRMVLFIKDSI